MLSLKIEIFQLYSNKSLTGIQLSFSSILTQHEELGMTQIISQNWGPLRTVLRSKCSASLVRKLVGATGIDMSKLPSFAGTPTTEEYDELMLALDHTFYSMSVNEQKRFLQIMVEELLKQKPDLEDTLQEYLSRLGWSLRERCLVPIDILDISELSELPADSTSDLLKASTRLRDGDLSGAVAAACGAVDKVTNFIYSQKSLGDPNNASYQERIKRSLAALGSFNDIKQDLIGLGWKSELADIFCKNLEGSINQAAFVMQTLRSNMSDVHGTKPVLKALVFDAIKWATLILRLFETE